MPVTKVKSKWVSGALVFTDTSGNTLIKMNSADHLYLNSPLTSPTKTVRINSQTYTSAASIIGLQTKPRAGVNMTNDIIGMESMPGIGVTAITSSQGIVCYKAEPYIHATAGAITGDVRGYEVSLGKPSGAGTISGTVSGVKFVNNANGTITGGVYPLYVLTHGDTLAWSGFAKLPNDGQIAYETGGTGWIKFRIGDKHGQVACTSMS